MEQTTVTHDYIAAILSSDPALIKQVYRQFYPMVRKMVLENSGSEDDAKDLFQDAVMVVYEKAGQPGFQLTSQFGTYLYGIAWNIWRSRLKKKHRTEVTIPDDAQFIADGLPTSVYDTPEFQRLILRAFAKLGKGCQELLLLFFQKMPMKDIAARMNYASDNYARKHKHDCSQQLGKLVKTDPEYEELLNT